MNKKPRGILPDAVNATEFIIIKSCSGLRPTYEIRLGAYMAKETRRRFRVILANGASAHPSLRNYAAKHGVSIEHRQ